MIQEIAAALTALSVSKDIAKSLIEIKDETKRNQVVIEFQSSLLDLQQNLFAANAEHEKLIDVKNQIERELMEYKDWEKEKKKYQLQKLREGLFVYSYKKANSDPTPDHWLCPYCFDKRKKNLITKLMESHTDHQCHECGFKFHYKH